MADPIQFAFGAGAVLGLGGLAHDIYSQSVSRRMSAQYNKWSQDYAERQYQAQQAAQLYNQGVSERNMAMQSRQFRENLDWQKYLAANGMRMRVEDLKRAGINPAVAANVAPVSGPVVSTSPVAGTSGIASGSAGYAAPATSNFRESSGVIRDSILSMYARHLSNRAMLYDIRATEGELARSYSAARSALPRSMRDMFPAVLRHIPY